MSKTNAVGFCLRNEQADTLLVIGSHDLTGPRTISAPLLISGGQSVVDISSSPRGTPREPVTQPAEEESNGAEDAPS